MWQKIHAKVSQRKAKNDGPSAPEEPCDSRASTPTLVADEEDSEEKASVASSRMEDVGLLPLESERPLSTTGSAHLDIIAIHGLGGKWDKTWKAPNGNIWLRDFLPHQLDEIEIKARIWSYGYNSKIAFSASVTDIADEARMLLDRIQGERVSAEEKARPIVFVAHSLGGILVKKAMVLAQERSGLYGNLLSKIHGIIFLATPHQGSDLARWATFAANLLKTMQLGRATNTAYISALKKNSKEFSIISQQWIERSAKLQIRTFYETEKLSGILVVDRDSACLNLPNEVAVGLAGSNHRTICKFDTPGDQRYRPVLNALKGIAGDIRALTMKIENAPFQWTNSHTTFVQLLDLTDYVANRARNPTREPGTCEWIARHAKFQTWLQSEASDILWLSGDPGCGKSVAASFLIDFLKASQLSTLVTYFFFKDDSERQSSAITALCAILHQIFTDKKRAQLVEHGMETYRKKGSSMISQFHCLWDTLVAALSDHQAGDVVLVLDALDECEEKERKFLIEALTTLCQKNTSSTSRVRFKIIITSRPYAAVQRTFKTFQTIRIRAESNLHSIDDDVNVVIDTRIDRFSDRMDMAGDSRLGELKDKLKKKADHTFLWVSLILDMLDESEDCTFAELHEIMDNPNPGVDSLYDKILSKARNSAKARKILHIILGAAEPLTADEVNIALSIKVGEPECQDKMQDRMFPSAEVGIREACGLFVRIIQQKVVLVHQTARSFLLSKSRNLSTDQSGSLKWSIHPTESSQLLAGICLTYLLSIKIPCELKYGDVMEFPEDTEVNPAKFKERNKFLNHAAKHFLKYMELSGSEAWNTSELGALALRLFSNHHAYVSWYIASQDAYVSSGSSAAGQDPYLKNAGIRETYIRALVPPLIYAANFNMNSLLKGLLEGGHDPNSVDHNGRPALLRAVKRGSLETTSLLLEGGADVNQGDGHTTALHLAVEDDNREIVKLLLTHGADRLSQSMTCAIPLHNARSPEVADLLLQERIAEQLASKDWPGRTPTDKAAKAGLEDVVNVMVLRRAGT